jgi:hypothetical protein
LAESQKQLKHYEWIETTVVTYKGEEKSNTQNRCYYGADGVLQKVPLTAAADEKRKKGLRGKSAEGKADYIKQAVELVKSYIPPGPAKIQAAQTGGNVSYTPKAEGTQVLIDFNNYIKSGDKLTMGLDKTNNRLMGIKVANYLKDAKDAVTLDVGVGMLQDSTSYPSSIVLEAKAEKMTISIKNSGYKKSGNRSGRAPGHCRYISTDRV